MAKLNYLNVGCGSRFHKKWTNIDMNSSSQHVKSCNLLKGIPFPDNQFDVLYHSQVLEHFPKEMAPTFIKECFRVLKPGGIIRVVVPDLENIAKEYLKQLHGNIEKPSKEAEANYDWIMLEMYDQTVRNHSGGQMLKFLQQPEIINEEYLVNRRGQKRKKSKTILKNSSLRRLAKKLPGFLLKKIKTFSSSKKQKIGSFRLGGEIHMWMYDRYSLSRLLSENGFKNIEIKSTLESSIPQWSKYDLDEKDDCISLFMEAQKQ